ncbi:hypothetical protein K435DRAFT_856039 [Dendrothele bispora CBS 962.96]|uniref:Uncharacterized protein n=1 Tax=Dendrothele bispora (strain CBS 962.96) TaxID=1314807 RepID=A0A4S8MAU3_DENBC|nr:hypothetical protein K435DRAFT_856039 [Dendrothele bispora CBS 962.96]
MLTEAQRIAYVGLCALTMREMLKESRKKELSAAASSMELWMMKIMGRLYYHMELETQERKMIESLAEHDVRSMDLVPALRTTHTMANPEYDPDEAKKKAEQDARNPPSPTSTLVNPSVSSTPTMPTTPTPATPTYPNPTYQTTTRVLPATTHPPTNPAVTGSDTPDATSMTVSTSLPQLLPSISALRSYVICSFFSSQTHIMIRVLAFFVFEEFYTILHQVTRKRKFTWPPVHYVSHRSIHILNVVLSTSDGIREIGVGLVRAEYEGNKDESATDNSSSGSGSGGSGGDSSGTSGGMKVNVMMAVGLGLLSLVLTAKSNA